MSCLVMPSALYVAPLAGAWIETLSCELSNLHDESRPSRARGLKPYQNIDTPYARRVAPLAGAWIETLDKKLKKYIM